jgi:hypothetical protein
MSPSMLYRCVATFELCSRLPVYAQWRHLTASHVRAVLPLDKEAQRGLLERAHEKRWSVSELESEVADVCRPKRLRDAGAPRRFERVLGHLESRLDEAKKYEAAAIAARDIAQMEDWLGILRRIRHTCDELEKAIQGPCPAQLPCAKPDKATG